MGDRLLVFSQVSGQRSFWMSGGPAGQPPDVFDKMLARLAALDPKRPPVPPKGACLLRVDQKRYCRQNALAPLRDFLSECGFDRDFAAAKGNARVTLSYAPSCPPGAVPFSRW